MFSAECRNVFCRQTESLSYNLIKKSVLDGVAKGV